MNFVLTATSIGSRLAAGLGLFIVLARAWGPGGFGLYAYLFGGAMLLGTIVDFGFATLLMRETGADRGAFRALHREALVAKAWLVLPFLAACAIGMAWAGPKAAPPVVALPLALSAIALSFAELHLAPLRAFDRFAVETRVVASSHLLHLAAVGGAAWAGLTIAETAWIALATRLQYLRASSAALRRVVAALDLPPVDPAAPAASLATTYRRALPYAIDAVVTVAWSQLDLLLLGSWYGPRRLGGYAAGQKLGHGLYTMAQVVGNVALPALARASRHGPAAVRQEARRTVTALAAVGSLGAVFLLAVGPWLLPRLFGPGFVASPTLLPLLALILALRYACAGASLVLIGVGRPGRRARWQCAGLATFASTTLVLAWAGAPLDMALCGYVAGLAVTAAGYRVEWRRWVRASAAPADLRADLRADAEAADLVTTTGGPASPTRGASAAVYLAWIDFQRRQHSMSDLIDLDCVYVPRRWRHRGLPGHVGSYFVATVVTLRALRRRRPDVVWLQLPPTPLLWVALLHRRLSRRPLRVVADCHNCLFEPPWSTLAGGVRWLRRCDLVVVHNDGVADMARAACPGLDPARLLVLPDPPARRDLAEVGEVPPEIAARPRPWILFPSSFSSDEPLADLLSAASHLPHATFIVTGRHADARAAGVDVTAGPVNVLYAGYLPLDRFNAVLAGCDVVLALTTGEQVQLSVCGEALGYAKALVVSRTHLLARDYGELAELATPGDPVALAQAVTRALQDRVRLEARMATEAERRRVAWRVVPMARCLEALSGTPTTFDAAPAAAVAVAAAQAAGPSAVGTSG